MYVWYVYFNPRSRTGATTISSSFFCGSLHFNPRSLTGATLDKIAYNASGSNFNPRSLTGATAQNGMSASFTLLFQSTLPHGSDE